MNCSTVQLLDLPDEMLIEIFNKITTVDVLYSILGVNKRLDRLARDPIFTDFLDLTTKTSFGKRCSLPDVMLDRFCSYILPQIHHNIQSLLVEPSSIERILLACDYPKLHKLILKSITSKFFIKYLADDSPIVNIFKQMAHLEIFTTEYYNTMSEMNLNTNAYKCLFSVCQHLTHLEVNGKHLRRNGRRDRYVLPLTMCSSSTIVQLVVNVCTIDDCLRLLDGRFNQMKTLIVNIEFIEAPSLNIDNQNNLSNLTTFILASCLPMEAEEYDNVIVPLLRQMVNLGKLGLCLHVENRSKFIDSADLYNNILIYMPQMTQFNFHIITMNDYVNIDYWLKNDDIEKRYIIDIDHPVIHCCIDYFRNGIGRCRISSFPFI